MHTSPLVDQHGHGVLHGELGLGTFERQLAAALGGPAGTGSSYDTTTGLALRRWCPPLLGLPPHTTAVRYLARRRELGAYAATRALLRGSGIHTYLVDPSIPGEGEGTGDGESDAVTDVRELAAAAGSRAHELVALTALAARVADRCGGVRTFPQDIAQALHTAARRAVAFVCDAATLRDGAPPEPAEVRRAAGRWLACGRRRTEPALTGHLLWAAFACGLPVQLRCADPRPLIPLLRATAGRAVIVLLPRRPHHEAAARLAAAFPHVYADVGPEPAVTLARAPFGKLLFSTGARGLPELHVVRVRQYQRAMTRLLGEWITQGECSRADARRIADRISGGTARGVYRLEERAPAQGVPQTG
ncbi:amidohydrolase [Streptomyces xiamenensis]|uniref:amidohydrolase n=1 Tax=Streptomyces xiamenensis TaxID=408015 RepID=UPI0035D63443